jgi:hypothetical protein
LQLAADRRDDARLPGMMAAPLLTANVNPYERRHTYSRRRIQARVTAVIA